MKNTVL